MCGASRPWSRAKRGCLLEVRPDVSQRARHVLDVDGVAAGDGLVAERAERFQVALERHEIEPPPELAVRRGGTVAFLQGEEIRDQLVELAVADVHVRVAQQRHQIVGVRPHAGVLEVDDVQAAFAQHQVAAVIVAMAQHARLRGELVDDRPPLLGERRSFGRAEHHAAVALDEVGREELELPRQLLDVERHAVGRVPVRVEIRTAPLQRLDQRHRLAVQRGVLGVRRGAKVRLQRDVPEILQRDDPELVRMPEHCGHRQRNQLATARRPSQTAARRSRSVPRAVRARSTDRQPG